MKRTIFLILVFVSENLYAVGDAQVGFMLGANYSGYQWNTGAIEDKFSTTGYGGGAGILVSLFQNNKIGFRINE